MYEMDAENLAKRSRDLTDEASNTLAFYDYTTETVMRLLVDALALQRDTLEALLRHAKDQHK